jgi:hypothetical protein
MRAYVRTTGVLFGLLAAVHVWRMVAESSSLATDPWVFLSTIAAAALCLWSWRLLRRPVRS